MTKKYEGAMTSIAQLVECCPMNLQVANSIPGEGTNPRLWAQSLVGGMEEAADLIFLSLSFSLAL